MEAKDRMLTVKAEEISTGNFTCAVEVEVMRSLTFVRVWDPASVTCLIRLCFDRKDWDQIAERTSVLRAQYAAEKEADELL